MYCAWCGRQLPDDARFCASCGRDLRPPVIEDLPAVAVAAPVTMAARTAAAGAHPWLRYWARSFDVFGLLTLLTVAGVLKPDSYFQSVIALYLAVPIEAALVAVAGTTPGKWLFRISIEDDTGGRPQFARSMRRTFGVLVYGMALLIPVASLFAQVIAFVRLTESGATRWDEQAGTHVRHGEISPLRAALIFAVFFALLAVLAVMSYVATQGEGPGADI
jgi:hypothetical protein